MSNKDVLYFSSILSVGVAAYLLLGYYPIWLHLLLILAIAR